MADLPIDLPDQLGERLSRSLDVEGKIPRALEALGPVSGRDVLLVDNPDGLRAQQLRALGARVSVSNDVASGLSAGDDSVDVAVGFWSSFRGAIPGELAEVERAVRPGGRLLVVHDYGRDDVSELRGDRPEYGTWSRPKGPFLSAGFKVRVVHCFWTFESMDDCADFLAAAFEDAGRTLAARLKRPRLSYNVAIYHRTLGEGEQASASATAPAPAQARPGDPLQTGDPINPAKAAG